MENINWTLVISLVAAFIMALPGIIAGINQRRADKESYRSYDTDAAKELTAAAIGLIRPYIERMKELEVEMSKRDRIVDSFWGILEGSWKLYHQVISLGGVPVYTPPEIEKFEDLR